MLAQHNPILAASRPLSLNFRWDMLMSHEGILSSVIEGLGEDLGRLGVELIIIIVQ